jgi:hypothetical protein
VLKVTPKQCKTARSLLKWNVHDLANVVKGVPAKRIESFEQGTVHLAEWENDQIMRALKKAGIAFKADLEVSLEKSNTTQEAQKTGGQGEGARIVLGANQAILADSSVQKGAAAEQLYTEDEIYKKEDKK